MFHKKGKIEEPKIEQIDYGRFKLTSFSTGEKYLCEHQEACEFDIPTGFRIGLIIIEVKGQAQVDGLEIRLKERERGEVSFFPLPASILKCHPISSEHSAYISFVQPLDLRSFITGDVRLYLTIKEANKGDILFVSSGRELILRKEA